MNSYIKEKKKRSMTQIIMVICLIGVALVLLYGVIIKAPPLILITAAVVMLCLLIVLIRNSVIRKKDNQRERYEKRYPYSGVDPAQINRIFDVISREELRRGSLNFTAPAAPESSVAEKAGLPNSSNDGDSLTRAKPSPIPWKPVSIADEHSDELELAFRASGDVESLPMPKPVSSAPSISADSDDEDFNFDLRREISNSVLGSLPPMPSLGGDFMSERKPARNKNGWEIDDEPAEQDDSETLKLLAMSESDPEVIDTQVKIQATKTPAAPIPAPMPAPVPVPAAPAAQRIVYDAYGNPVRVFAPAPRVLYDAYGQPVAMPARLPAQYPVPYAPAPPAPFAPLPPAAKAPKHKKRSRHDLLEDGGIDVIPMNNTYAAPFAASVQKLPPKEPRSYAISSMRRRVVRREPRRGKRLTLNRGLLLS